MAQTRVGVRKRNLFNTDSSLWNNLVAYFTGDNTTDDYLGNYEGVLTNGATYDNGILNNGFKLDGVNDYVDYGDSLNLHLDNWSYSCWIKLDGLSGNMYAFSKAFYGPGKGRFGLYKSTNNKLGFLFVGISTNILVETTDTTVNADEWYHVSVTLDRDDKIKMYVNGVLQNLTTTSGTNDLKPHKNSFLINTFPFRIGTYTYNNYGSWAEFNGTVDELGVWNRVLTQSEITELYNNGLGKECDKTITSISSPNVITDSLVLHLNANDSTSYPGTGTIWFDLSGNGNDGTLVNGVSFSKDYKGIMSFDGVNDYVIVNDDPTLDFGSNNFTVEYWVRKHATTIGTSWGNGWGVNKWNTGANPATTEWSLGIGGTNTDTYGLSISDGTKIYSSESNQIPLYEWVQIVGIRDGAYLKTYLNGVLTSNTIPTDFTETTVVNNIGNDLYIANSALNAYHTKCSSSVIRVYTKALTDSEVLQNYNSTKGRFGL
jgi:hypothetical protein